MFEMNEEQAALFNALTPLQKEVSLNSISGMNDIDAYKASKGKAKTLKTMEACVSELLSNPKVKAFIKSMASHIVNPAVMSRQEMIERLSGLARTNMSDLITWGLQGDTVATDISEDGEELDPEDYEEGQAPQSVWVIKPSALQDKTKVASIAEVSSGKDGIKIKQHSPLAAMKQLAELAGYEAPKQVEILAKEELTPWSKMSFGDN
jgi:phage terminase small subunit